MATKTQLRNRVLRKLGVIEGGGTPGSDEITDTELAFDELHAFLLTKEAVTWDSDEDVPDEAANHFAIMLVASIADEYVDESRVARYNQQAYGIPGVHDGALGQLIDLATPDYVSTPVKATYY